MQVKDIKKDADYGEVRKIVAEQTGESVGIVSEVIDTFFNVLAEVLAMHNRYEHAGLGVISLLKRAPRQGIDPQGEPFETAARLEIEFHASKIFANKVQVLLGDGTQVI